MLTFLQIAGGVALTLFGVRFLRKGLDRLFGAKLAVWLQKLSQSRIRAMFAGAAAAAVMPSSTSITLLAVQTVQAGQMTASQMLAVLLGANIGLTVMVQLVAFRIDAYAPVLILMGVMLFQGARSAIIRGIGQVLLSLGLVFLAISIINTAAQAAITASGTDGDVVRLIQIAERHPAALVVLAALITLIVQSSTVTLGLVIGLQNGAHSTSIGLQDGTPSTSIALAAVIGANLGLALSSLLVGWRHLESRRLGAANLLLKAGVAVVALLMISMLVSAFEHSSLSPGRLIANGHTLFNLVAALIGLPLIPLLNRLVGVVTDEHAPGAQRPFGPRYIQDAPLDSAPIALSQSMREILRVSEIVRSMLAELWVAFEKADVERTREISHRDDQVDQLDAQIKAFLIRLGTHSDEIANSQEQLLQLSYLTELETIGDIVDKNLSEIVAKQIRLGTAFSPVMRSELKDFHSKVCENLLIAETLFTRRDRMLAEQLWRHRDWLGRQSYALRDQHFARMNAGEICSHESTAAYIDLLGNLTRINNCVSHLAYAILQDALSKDRRSNREQQWSVAN